MSYQRTMICLANSRKHSGRCMAGKLAEGQEPRQWIRPVGTSPSAEITEYDRLYENGQHAQALDVIEITLDRPHHHSFQAENHVIDPNCYWTKVGVFNPANLFQIEDRPASLWENGEHSYSGVNDRVVAANLNCPRETLFLIRPIDINYQVSAEGAIFGNEKKVVRANFSYQGINYALRVTDPVIESKLLRKEEGIHSLDTNFIVVSLGEIWEGHAYKLVAAVF